MKHEEIIKKIDLADECHMDTGGNFGRTMTITMEEAWLFKKLLNQQANGLSTDSGQSNIPDVIARFLKKESKDLKIRHDGIKVGIEYAHKLKTERLYITHINGHRMNSYELNEL